MVKQCILTSIVLLTMALISSAQTKKITVSGNVVDNNGKPVYLAHITFSDMDTTGGITPATDTLLTKADGTFSKQITLNSTAKMLVYIVVMDGHKAKTGYNLQLSPNMNLGTMTIDVASQDDSLKISGLVQDKSTNNPVEGVQVILSVVSSIISLPDTVYTKNDGRFSHTIAGTTEGIVSMKPFVYYTISKKNFTEVKDSLVPTKKEIDLGTIKMKQLTNIKHNFVLFNETSNQPHTITIYTLQGKKIFQGTKESFSLNKTLYALPTQWYIYEKKYKGVTISQLQFGSEK